jgi:hypothetical protein
MQLSSTCSQKIPPFILQEDQQKKNQFSMTMYKKDTISKRGLQLSQKKNIRAHFSLTQG